MVEQLLLANADANAQSKEGWTALHGAAENGHGAVVELLEKWEQEHDHDHDHAKRK